VERRAGAGGHHHLSDVRQNRPFASRNPSEMKVLVIEDQPAVAKALRLLFDVHDIACETTSDPAAALARIGAGGVDVVVQDMNFTPGKTSGDEGITLFRRIRAQAPALPIVLLTAWTSLETAVQLVKEGAADYLAKPWDDAKLLATIRGVTPEERPGARRDLVARGDDLRGTIYESEAMHRVVSLALKIARSDVPVLITGPNGAGKEKIAEIIHANSRRAKLPFVKVNAGALPESLLESELFGAEPGAYTGSNRLRLGRFEAADKGSLFLDEIGNLPSAGQTKLLRVLQSGEFERLGSSQTRRVDARVLAATNADLRDAIARGTFRQDLYFRLNVVEIAVPPLRDRRDDILPLARHILAGVTREHGLAKAPLLGDAATEALLAFDWPGNVRELQNRITRAALTARSAELTPHDLGLGDDRSESHVPLEKKQIELALLDAGGSVSRAAEAFGISRQALYRRMEKLGIVLERRPK
jgi:DNA-binding NtrC family response regulator